MYHQLQVETRISRCLGAYTGSSDAGRRGASSRTSSGTSCAYGEAAGSCLTLLRGGSAEQVCAEAGASPGQRTRGSDVTDRLPELTHTVGRMSASLLTIWSDPARRVDGPAAKDPSTEERRSGAICVHCRRTGMPCKGIPLPGGLFKLGRAPNAQ
jgi:hypothetical protein